MSAWCSGQRRYPVKIVLIVMRRKGEDIFGVFWYKLNWIYIIYKKYMYQMHSKYPVKKF